MTESEAAPPDHPREATVTFNAVASSEIESFARDHRMSTARRLLQHLGEKMEHADGSSDAVGGAR